MSSRTITQRMKTSGYNYNRKMAKDVLRNKTKRERPEKVVLTDDDRARMAVFLKHDKEAHNGQH